MRNEAAMDTSPIRVLLIDDDEDDCLLTHDLLGDIQGLEFALDWVQTYEAGVDALARRAHDVCLLDYRLDGRTGLELLKHVVAQAIQTPIILLTGQGDR